MNFYTKLKKNVKFFFKFILSLATNKKTILFLVGCLLFYNFKSLPIRIDTSSFLKILNSSDVIIEYLLNLNNKVICYDTIDKNKYICDYLVNNSESFNKILTNKNISFDYASGIRSIICHPYTLNYSLSFLFGWLLLDFISERKLKTKMLIKSTNEDVLKDFVADDKTKNQIKLILNQLTNPEKYKDKNIKMTKGCLVYGKPGTGKTLLARVQLLIL
jgi:ATP-dependent Zn protease